MRSKTVLLLSLSLLATAGQNALIGPIRFSNLALLNADISAVIYALLGGLVLVYWFFVEPDYRREVRPLGVAIMAVESMVIGVSILAAGAFLLLFPIIGLVGVIGGGIGLGLLWLGRGLWNGKPLALEVMLLFTVIGIVAGLIGLAFGLGVPILGLYQFWYLRRPNVKDFYYWKPAPQSAISLRTATGEESLLRIEGLRTYFYTYAGIVKAVDGVSLQVGQGETVGIVGESGSGKTVTALSIMRIVPPPGRIVEGRIIFQGRDILNEREEDVQRLRGKEIGYIFQDPTSTLDPVYTVGQQLCEVLMRHQNLDPKTALARAIELLRLVEIPDPEVRINQYPHELSGGTKQRIAIARALSCNPSLLLADEPTTALDVTIQAQILELMKSLKSKFNMSMVLISHDLGVVAETCDRIVILYAGQVYESGTTAQVLENPKHPYTESLLTSVPSLALRKGRLSVIPGNIPNLIDPPSGCRFHPRCKYAQQICIDKVPELEVMEEGHLAACHRAKELKLISPVAS